MNNPQLIYIQDAIYCNLSHHLYNNSGLLISIDKKYNELCFYIDQSKKGVFIKRIFTIFFENDTYELLPTDDHKSLIPGLITKNIDDLIFYITHKFNHNDN